MRSHLCLIVSTSIPCPSVGPNATTSSFGWAERSSEMVLPHSERDSRCLPLSRRRSLCATPHQSRPPLTVPERQMGPGPKAWLLSPGSVPAQSAKGLNSLLPSPVTSHASVCISFCFYGVFWSNLNFQLFIFTKENKIAVARPFLSISVLLLSQVPIFIASPVLDFCRGLERRIQKHA